MAYYSSSEYYEVPYGYESYGGGYDSTPIQSSPAYSTSNNYNYGSPTPEPYYHDDYGSILSYCASTFSVPKFLQHSPALTQFVVAEFNEPDFQEYDPTPYGGGYDLVATYGKPLPPSDQTCYQGSKINVKEAPAKEEIKEPKPEPPLAPAHETPTVVTEATQLSGRPQPKKPSSVQETPISVTGESEPTQLSECQSGYGFEDSAFGYSCPCCCHANSHGGYCIGRGERQPNWGANYIFGCSAYPYGQGRELGGNYPNPVFGYERHYQEQSLHGYVQYEEPSLLNTSNNFF